MTKSIFLAGPTPRDKDVKSWRPEALATLQELGYDGVVFVPEQEDGQWKGSYLDQVNWEEQALHRSDCVLFWVPRVMATMPALTTNVEFGRWYESGRLVFGAPETAAHVRYLEHYAKDFHSPCALTLRDTLVAAVEMVGEGALRHGGQCEVPLLIWKTRSFQQWYHNLIQAGHRLDGARVEWTFRVGPKKSFVFFWILHVNVHIAGEGRNKMNEVVIARPDIATICMFRRGPTLLETEIALIREFRSPVSNKEGFVFELPGGSSFKPGDDPRALAAAECSEETGLVIAPERLTYHGSRQLVATLSAHHAHLFSVELDAHEMLMLRDQQGTFHGVEEETERTYVEVRTLQEIFSAKSVDWSMVGMMLSVLSE